MDHTLNVPDDVMLRIMRASSLRGQLDACLQGVCRRWRDLLRDGYKRARHTQVAPTLSADAALGSLRACRNVTHVRLWGRLSFASELGELLRRLAAGEDRMPWLTSFHLDIVYESGTLDDLTLFLSKRAGLEALRFAFCFRPEPDAPKYTWQDIHAYLEELDFVGSLPRLEHLTLEYQGLYRLWTSCRKPRPPNCSVPLSRTLVSPLGSASALKTFHLTVSNQTQLQWLPPWLGGLQQFASLTMSHVTPAPVPIFSSSSASASAASARRRWRLFPSLAAMVTLQELNLSVHDKGFGAAELATLAELRSLRKLRLAFGHNRIPELTRALPRLEDLAISLTGEFVPPVSIPHNLFAFTPGLRSLDLRAAQPLTWPALAGLAKLTSLTVGCYMGEGEGQGSDCVCCCDMGGLPALRHLELSGCRLLPLVGGLSSLGDATGVSFLCRCRSEPSSVRVESYLGYVRARCQRLPRSSARQLFQDSRGQAMPAGKE